MSKKNIIVILLLALFSMGIISLYATFAYNEEESKLDDSLADYNLVYSLEDNREKNIIINDHDEKYIDLELNNPYEATLKYGIYYKLISPNKMPDNVKIEIADGSISLGEDNIKSNEKKIVTLKIANESDYNLKIIVGALVGFEKGNISELVTNGEILIK